MADWLFTITDPAQPCELVSLATVKTRLGIAVDDKTNDVFLQAQIDFISGVIASYCERVFCANEYTQIIKRPANTGLVWNSSAMELYHYPVNTITQVTINGTVVDSADYELNERDWTLVSSSLLSAYDVNVQFNGGFQTMPSDVAMAAEDLVVSRFQQKDGDPTRIVRSESVPEIGSVDYVSSTYYQRGFDPIIGNYGTTLDRYRTERAIVPSIGT